MQLVKLEINGFKSFAKKTELTFEKGITGILGPNGCGKSNIADAFRFVLGEQNARALRGKRIQDFIFGGTAERRPLSFCEVSMYFDNSDGALQSPYTEVVVTRRAFRSGESEYSINRTACRLKDIHDLFRDTGIGKDGYSIIGQGRVGEILADRSNERREVFEEAAGVMKYRARKEEAERKLINTRKNLIRLDDILSELGARLETLKYQSEKAESYFKLRDELRAIELSLFLYQYEKSSERLSQLSDTAAQLDMQITEALASEAAVSTSCAEEEERERKLSEAISAASQRLVSLSSSVEALIGDEKLLNERILSVRTERERHSASIIELKTDIENKSAEVCSLRKQLEESCSSDTDLKSKLEAIMREQAECEDEFRSNEALLEAQKQSMMDSMNRLADAKVRATRLNAMRTSFVSRLDAIRAEKAECIAEGKRLDSELNSSMEQTAAVKANRAAAASKRESAIIRCNETNQLILSSANKLRDCENELGAVRSRYRVLVEMKRAHEGYYSSVRKLLHDVERNPALSSRIEGVVAELLCVPKEYETAVEMALGAALQHIVVASEQDAKFIIGYLREHDYGRATLLPISAMRPRLLLRDEMQLLSMEGCFGVASELVDCPDRIRGVLENLLGRTVIVRDIDTGIALSRRAKSAFRVATLKGDILNPGGSMTGGSLQKREFSLLGREREIENLSAKEGELLCGISDIKAKNDALQAKLNTINGDIEACSKAIGKLDINLAAHSEKVDIIGKYLKKNSEQLAALELEEAQVNDSISDIDTQIDDAEKAESGITEGNAVTNDDIKRTQQAAAALRERQGEINQRLTDVKVQLMAVNKERDSTEAEMRRIQKEVSSASMQIDRSTEAVDKANSAIIDLEDKLEQMQNNLSNERSRLSVLTDELHNLEAERSSHLDSMDELRASKERFAHELTDMRERRHRIELNINRLSMELDNMSDRIWKDYELTYDSAQSYRRQVSVAQANLRCDELRKGIKELGEVNTSSIEDYRSVRERYDGLKLQCDDLHNAEHDIEELIVQLTSTMEKEFKEQFALIQHNFKQTFSELFGGGQAELVLSDENDVLNCSIDIVAQPPGKKLQLLTLLSGGEQALTAISLLFAILKLKPAAFCILDEIDTSLDEANVDNFADYLKAYSDGTQFILITHRKGAMAACNALYGVSMEEKGVSSLISARFID